MKRDKRLPDVLLMSDKASTLMSNSTKDACICIESDDKGVSFKDEPSEGVTMDITAEYRNIVQLWHPATEKPHCIGQILCWRRDGNFFVHNHYSFDEENWHLFVNTNNVKRYCYISNLKIEWFI